MSIIDVIKKRSEFVFIGRIGARSKTQNLIVLCVKRNGDSGDAPRVGYTASRKVGNAIKRNKAKRRLRSLVSLKSAFFEKGFSFVFIATSKTVFNYNIIIVYKFNLSRKIKLQNPPLFSSGGFYNINYCSTAIHSPLAARLFFPASRAAAIIRVSLCDTGSTPVLKNSTIAL